MNTITIYNAITGEVWSHQQLMKFSPWIIDESSNTITVESRPASLRNWLTLLGVDYTRTRNAGKHVFTIAPPWRVVDGEPSNIQWEV